MSTRVWVCQCLCPQRHCILAAAGEADSQAAAEEAVENPLRASVNMLLTTRAANSWCGLCKAGQETWRYELARTRFRTIEEAAPYLERSEAEQAAMRAVWGDLPRSD